MFHVIDGLFDRYELEALQEAVAGLDFSDGRATAGLLARDVKNNMQARDTPGRKAVLRKVETALMQSQIFRAAALPKAIVRMLVSRYADGQSYGTHVDDAIMDGARTDLSFTLFLNDPSLYDGGALIVEEPVEERAFRLPAGAMILYPSGSLHRVGPVTRGARLAVVGWITSRVRDAAQRGILFDLDAAIASERQGKGDPAQIFRLARTRSNLLRMWVE